MAKITSVIGHEILDSRGNPTVGATVVLDDGTTASAAVPSGASTGSREAVELRDADKSRFGGKGVLKAVSAVNGELGKVVTGLQATDQRAIDQVMIDLDGTANKGRVGANAILAISLAALRAGAVSSKKEVFQHIAELAGNDSPTELPVPMFNVLNGGAHAMGSTDFQEFMVVPAGIGSFKEAIRCGAEMYQWLQKIHADGHATTVGDEGGFAPQGLTNRQALEYATAAIEGAGYKPGEEVFIALDPASSEFYVDGVYDLSRESRKLSSEEMVEEYATLAKDFPIYSVEDGLAEDDWAGWEVQTARTGDRIQLVGDDLYVTQAKYVQQGIDTKAGNAVLVKLNPVGSVSETLDTVALAQNSDFGVVISHRSGETEDTSIADLAVGTSAGQIKTGAPARSERIAKYNRLLRIEELLGSKAQYAGKRVLPNS